MPWSIYLIPSTPLAIYLQFKKVMKNFMFFSLCVFYFYLVFIFSQTKIIAFSFLIYKLSSVWEESVEAHFANLMQKGSGRRDCTYCSYVEKLHARCRLVEPENYKIRILLKNIHIWIQIFVLKNFKNIYFRNLQKCI